MEDQGPVGVGERRLNLVHRAICRCKRTRSLDEVFENTPHKIRWMRPHHVKGDRKFIEWNYRVQLRAHDEIVVDVLYGEIRCLDSLAFEFDAAFRGIDQIPLFLCLVVNIRPLKGSGDMEMAASEANFSKIAGVLDRVFDLFLGLPWKSNDEKCLASQADLFADLDGVYDALKIDVLLDDVLDYPLIARLWGKG